MADGTSVTGGLDMPPTPRKELPMMFEPPSPTVSSPWGREDEANMAYSLSGQFFVIATLQSKTVTSCVEIRMEKFTDEDQD